MPALQKYTQIWLFNTSNTIYTERHAIIKGFKLSSSISPGIRLIQHISALTMHLLGNNNHPSNRYYAQEIWGSTS